MAVRCVSHPEGKVQVSLEGLGYCPLNKWKTERWAFASGAKPELTGSACAGTQSELQVRARALGTS